MWKYPFEVDGWLSLPEAEILRDASRGKVCIEFGAWCGKSTITMAQEATFVHSVDWHRGDRATGARETLSTFLGNLSRYGVRDKVGVYVARIEDFARLECQGFADLVFVDASHDEGSCYRDIQLAKQCLRAGGKIAVHDSLWPGVLAATSRAMAGWTIEREADAMRLWARLTR